MDLKREEKFVGIEKVGDAYGFHGTALEDYLRCKRKFYFRYILGLVPKNTSAPLIFGKAIHAGAYVWYATQKDISFINNIMSEEEQAKAKARYQSVCERDAFALLAFDNEFDKQPVESSKCTRENGIAGLVEYFNYYRNLDEEYEPRNLEISQKVLMPNGTLICITLDRLFIKDDYVKVADLKTTSKSLTDYFWKAYENSFQLKGYYYACQQVYSVDNVQVDGFHYPLPVKKTENPNYERRTFFFTDMQMEDYLITYNTITNEILEYIQLPKEKQPFKFHTCETSCSDFGGCPYIDVCKHGFKHPSVKINFDIEAIEL